MSAYPHYAVRKFFTDTQCDRIAQYLEAQEGDVVKTEKEGQVYYDLDTTNTNLYDRVYEKCWNVVESFNFSSRGWGFDINDWQQDLRVSRYDGGAGMDWHMDYTKEDASKIAFSVALSDPDWYTGGDFHLLETEPLERLRRGYGVIFPAFAGHKVDPVTSGTRYVLLGWLTGPRFT